MSPRRPLSADESEVLALVTVIWGPQNTEDLVNFVEGEAHIWVQTREGETAMFISLTNLAEMRRDGTLSAAELAHEVRGPFGARA